MGKSEKKLRGKGNEGGGNTLSNINIRNRHATAAQSSPIISGAKNVHSTFYTPRLGAPSQFQNSSPYLAYFKFQRPAEKIGAQSDFPFVVLTIHCKAGVERLPKVRGNIYYVVQQDLILICNMRVHNIVLTKKCQIQPDHEIGISSHCVQSSRPRLISPSDLLYKSDRFIYRKSDRDILLTLPPFYRFTALIALLDAQIIATAAHFVSSLNPLPSPP